MSALRLHIRGVRGLPLPINVQSASVSAVLTIPSFTDDALAVTTAQVIVVTRALVYRIYTLAIVLIVVLCPLHVNMMTSQLPLADQPKATVRAAQATDASPSVGTAVIVECDDLTLQHECKIEGVHPDVCNTSDYFITMVVVRFQFHFSILRCNHQHCALIRPTICHRSSSTPSVTQTSRDSCCSSMLQRQPPLRPVQQMLQRSLIRRAPASELHRRRRPLRLT